MKYNEPYESDPEIRDFMIVTDIMKLFVDPRDNTIDEPEVCATILTIFEPIIRRAGVFAQAVGPVFDPNDVVDCLVNEVYPAFMARDGIPVPERPKVSHITPLKELPMDINHYDWIYHQIMTWLYNNHEDENLEIVDIESLRADMRTALPMMKAIVVWEPLFDKYSDDEFIEVQLRQRVENEKISREIHNEYEEERG